MDSSCGVILQRLLAEVEKDMHHCGQLQADVVLWWHNLTAPVAES